MKITESLIKSLINFRVFVAVTCNKRWRVFSDFPQGCQSMSAEQWCPLVVLCLLYLNQTDEIAVGSVGFIQPWKICVNDSYFEGKQLLMSNKFSNFFNLFLRLSKYKQL